MRRLVAPFEPCKKLGSWGRLAPVRIVPPLNFLVARAEKRVEKAGHRA